LNSNLRLKGGDDLKKPMLAIDLALALLASTAFGAEQKTTCRHHRQDDGQVLL
jgi:hypothetical protein